MNCNDRTTDARETNFQYRLCLAYAFLTPILVIPLGGELLIGTIDLLLPIGLFALLRQKQVGNGLINAWFIFFVLAGSLSSVVTIFTERSDSSEPLLIIRMFAIYIPMILVLSTRLLQERHFIGLIKTSLVSLTFSSVIGVILHLLGVQIRPEQQRLWGLDGSTLRAGGLLGNSGDMGHIAALLGVLAITLGVVYLNKRWVLIPLVGLSAYVVYIASSRAGLLALLVAAIFMFPVYFGGRKILVLFFGIPFAFIAAASALNSMNLSGQISPTLRRFDLFNLTGSTEFLASDTRLSSWSRLLEAFQESPIFGIGYGNAQIITGAGDNSFLSILSETGLIAGIGYISLWIALLILIIRLPAGAGKFSALALLLSEISFMLTIDTHRMWPSTPLFLLAIALGIRLAQKESLAVQPDAKAFQTVSAAQARR